MPIDVVMPQMGESIFEGTITKWLKKTGDAVRKDEPLFEISTDKVDAEIPAPVSGVLTEIKVPGRGDGADQHGGCSDRRRSAGRAGRRRSYQAGARSGNARDGSSRRGAPLAGIAACACRARGTGSRHRTASAFAHRRWCGAWRAKTSST